MAKVAKDGNGLTSESAAMLERDRQDVEWFAARPAYLGGLEARQAKELLRLVADRLNPPTPEAIHEKVANFLAIHECIRAGAEAEAVSQALAEAIG